MPVYAQSYALSHPNTLVDSSDIRAIDARQIRHQLGLAPKQLDLLSGVPPCQGFSINAPVRSLADSRNHLFREFLRFVAEFEPKMALIENVPGLVSFEKGATLSAVLSSLSDLGYVTRVQILYAPNFGVPQTRWRTIILGGRIGVVDEISYPKPDFFAPARPNFTSNYLGESLLNLPKMGVGKHFITVGEAISDLPILANGEEGEEPKSYLSKPLNTYQEHLRSGSLSVYNHEAARLGAINMERLSHIPPGGNWTDIPTQLLPAGMRRARRSDHTKRYGRSDPDGLASTILTKCDPHWGAYFHYNQDRVFTVREAARLQSFPDRCRFLGSRAEQYEQVGNAVPPLLARAIGRALLATLNNDSYVRKVS